MNNSIFKKGIEGDIQNYVPKLDIEGADLHKIIPNSHSLLL